VPTVPPTEPPAPPPTPPSPPPPAQPKEPTLADIEQGVQAKFNAAASPEDFGAATREAFHWMDRAIVDGDQESAKRAGTLALASARKSGENDLAKVATLRFIEVQSPLTDEVKDKARQRIAAQKPPK